MEGDLEDLEDLDFSMAWSSYAFLEAMEDALDPLPAMSVEKPTNKAFAPSKPARTRRPWLGPLLPTIHEEPPRRKGARRVLSFACVCTCAYGGAR